MKIVWQNGKLYVRIRQQFFFHYQQSTKFRPIYLRIFREKLFEKTEFSYFRQELVDAILVDCWNGCQKKIENCMVENYLRIIFFNNNKISDTKKPFQWWNGENYIFSIKRSNLDPDYTHHYTPIDINSIKKNNGQQQIHGINDRE